MRNLTGLVKAALIFLTGALCTQGVFLALKLFLVWWIGIGISRLPDLQQERLQVLRARTPMVSEPVVVMGDSTASFSIDAALLRDATSLASVNSTSLESYYLLKELLDSGARPRCVLASFSFIWSQNRKNFWPLFGSTRFYSDAELEEIFAVSHSFGELPGAEFFPLRKLRKLGARLGIGDTLGVGRIQAGVATASWERLRMSAFRDGLWLHRGSTPLADRSHFEGKLDLFYDESPGMSKTEEEYFRRYLELLKKHQIRFFLYSVPFADSVQEAKVKQFWTQYDALLEKFQLSEQPRFHRIPAGTLPERFFLSAGHLNSAGLAQTAAQLREALAGCYP